MEVSIRDWQRLYARLTSDVPPGYNAFHPGAEATKAAAADFEKAVGHKLPRSYKAFIQVFGPGELGGYYRISVPGDHECGYDLATEHALCSQTYTPAESYEQGELLRRLIYFASTIGGEMVGWDPLDVTDTTGPEYRTYYVTRSATSKAIADSFPEFVSEICLKNNLYKFFGWKNQEPDDWPPQSFLPYRVG